MLRDYDKEQFGLAIVKVDHWLFDTKWIGVIYDLDDKLVVFMTKAFDEKSDADMEAMNVIGMLDYCSENREMADEWYIDRSRRKLRFLKIDKNERNGNHQFAYSDQWYNTLDEAMQVVGGIERLDLLNRGDIYNNYAACQDFDADE